ncbi:16S rRNA (uracil1498-N3)-methyltransferase [Alteromonadaceae bacterium Bs31]|nr:16S rRNA (uracil1498-N3)-methyltransferase [Alteromonadaceae bacterium Bs31]
MRIPRIYTAQTLSLSRPLELEEEAAHHLVKVLRMQVGRELLVFDNSGKEYSATIESISKKTCTLEITHCRDIDRESPLCTELAIGLSRGERFDWVLQKATELGVSRIVPLFTERTEVKLQPERLQKRYRQWQKILIASCEQCQRNRLPELVQALTLENYLQQTQAELKLVLHHRSNNKIGEYTKPASTALLVGPEGGLSDNEITAAQNAGFKPLTMGPRVFRTETAPVAALAVIQSLWGDLN